MTHLFSQRLELKLLGLPECFRGNPFICIYDTETSGKSYYQNELITGSFEIRDFNFDLKDEIDVKAKPGPKKKIWDQKEKKYYQTWDEGAERVHGISYGEACTFPDRRKTAIQLLHFLKPFKSERNNPILFVAHDLNNFDSQMLCNLFKATDLIFSFRKVFHLEYQMSTIKMSRDIGRKQNSLDNWAKQLNIKLNHHNATSDRKACSEVFKYLVEAEDVCLN